MDKFEQHIKRMKGLRDVYEAGTGQHNILSMLITECEIALRQPPTECSAYYVHIAGQGETCVVAENIADAMDKIEKLTEANYTFIFNRSLPCII